MMFSSGHSRPRRSLAVLAVSLYAVAVLAGALHPMVHGDAESDHFAYGICGTGCAEHHVDAEQCNTCATLTKKVSSSIDPVVAFGLLGIDVIVPDTMAIPLSSDTQLPGLRAPPATA